MPSRLIKEALKIGGGRNAPIFLIECHFKSPQGTQKVYDVNQVDFDDNYFDGSFGSNITVSVMTDINLYNEYIYPTKQALEIVLIYRQCDKESGSVVHGGINFTREYRGMLVNAVDGGFGGTSQVRGSSKDAMKQCTIQLIEYPVMNVLRLNAGGQFKLTPTMDAMMSILSIASNPSGNLLRDTIRFAVQDSDVPAPPTSIIVPHDKRLVEVPHYIQEHCGGLYQFGLGSFIKNKVWHIYPLYNLDAVKRGKGKKLTVIHVPPTELPGLDRTWTSVGDDVRILSTGEVKVNDLSASLQLEHGTGVRMVRSDAMFSAPTEDNDKNQSEFKPENYMAGFTTEQRLDGNTVAPILPIGTTVNEALSMMAATKLQLMTIQWQNSDIHLIYPGMPTTVMYDNDGSIKVHNGKVLAIREIASKIQGGVTNKAMQTSATITLMITRNPIKVI